MTVVFNYILLVILIAATAVVIALQIRKISKTVVETEYENPFTLKHYISGVDIAFATALKEDLKTLNLTRRELEAREYTKQELRKNLEEASYGNRLAKSFILGFIKDIIRDKELNLNESNIDKLMHFNDPKKLRRRDKFEIMVYLFNKEYDRNGLTKMIEEFEWYKPSPSRNGGHKYNVSNKMLDKAFDSVIRDGRYNLSYNDKLEIISRRIFSDYIGHGPVDLIADSTIDEYDGGVSGMPDNGFDIAMQSDNMNEFDMSYDAIWVMYHGCNIHFSFLSFGSQTELVRICKNIYRYNAPKPLSKNNPKVLSTMKDGSRILVVRPPFSDGWCFFARKFDSTPSIAPEKLFKDDGAENLIKLVSLLARGDRTMAITGSQGSGKSTALKSFIQFIPEEYSLRTQENAFELNLRYAYPLRNIVSFQETDTVSAQAGLDLQKKTNGVVNIIGEDAEAAYSKYILQTATVASRFSWFTQHADSTDDLVFSMKSDVLREGGYSDEKTAEETVAKIINFDFHMEKEGTHRFCQHLTEIVPIRDRRYPSEILRDKHNGKIVAFSSEESTTASTCFADGHEPQTYEEELALDTMEYQRRITDRTLYSTRDIVVFEDGKYKVKNLPTEFTLNKIRKNLTAEERVQFEEDLENLKKCIGED